jgi:hypothetical protein
MITGFDRSKKPNFSVKACSSPKKSRLSNSMVRPTRARRLGDILGEALKAKPECEIRRSTLTLVRFSIPDLLFRRHRA